MEKDLNDYFLYKIFVKDRDIYAWFSIPTTSIFNAELEAKPVFLSDKDGLKVVP